MVPGVSSESSVTSLADSSCSPGTMSCANTLPSSSLSEATASPVTHRADGPADLERHVPAGCGRGPVDDPLEDVHPHELAGLVVPDRPLAEPRPGIDDELHPGLRGHVHAAMVNGSELAVSSRRAARMRCPLTDDQTPTDDSEPTEDAAVRRATQRPCAGSLDRRTVVLAPDQLRGRHPRGVPRLVRRRRDRTARRGGCLPPLCRGGRGERGGRPRPPGTPPRSSAGSATTASGRRSCGASAATGSTSAGCARRRTRGPA